MGVPAERNRTNGEGSARLHGKQEIALRAILRGRSLTVAAAEAGTRRETVSEWVNHNKIFRSELRGQQEMLREAVRTRIEISAVQAADTLHELLEDESSRTRLMAAKAILGLAADLSERRQGPPPGLLGVPRYSGEAERQRWEQLTSIPPSDRETLRQIFALIDTAPAIETEA